MKPTILCKTSTILEVAEKPRKIDAKSKPARKKNKTKLISQGTFNGLRNEFFNESDSPRVMGCCQSSFLKPSLLRVKKASGDVSARRCGKRSNRNNRHRVNNEGVGNGRGWHFSTVPDLAEFSAAALREATNNFSVNAVVSVCSDQTPNVVYRGCLKDDMRQIAVKKFSKSTWPDPKQFAVCVLKYSFIICP